MNAIKHQLIQTRKAGFDVSERIRPHPASTDRTTKNRPNTLVAAASVRWRTLAEKVYCHYLSRLLELLYSDSESCVPVGNIRSEWFSISSGVGQGCVVAPDLFNCVIDHLMCQLKTAAGPSLAIDLDNWRLTDMDYTDDIALFSPSSEDLCSVLCIPSNDATKVGMSISWTKTKAMMISPSSAITTPMNIDGELVEQS